MHFDASQARFFHIKRQQLMRNRARVRRVEIKMRRENGEAFRVRRLDGQHAAALQFRGAEPDHLRQALRRQMLHHLRTEDAIELAIRLRGEVREKIGHFGVRAFCTALRHGFLAEIDAARRHADSRMISRNSPRPQPISSTFVRPAKIRFVELQIAPDVFFGAAEALGETAVIEIGGAAERRAARRKRPAPLRPGPSKRALPDEPQFAMNQPFILAARLLQVRPETLLNIEVGAVERAQIIRVLRS